MTEFGAGGLVLGIETSCDETAAAIVDPRRPAGQRLLAHALRSQEVEHGAFGGVVPEIAARSHLTHLPGLIDRALAEAGARVADLALIAATCGPGLIGGVIVGAMTAKAMAAARGVPFSAVNHLEAHALSPRFESVLPFPYLLLLISGGHCQLLRVDGVGRYRRLGGTIDDAAGEAFDKVAKLLGLGFPGGPALERCAASGDPARFALARPLLGRPGCDFSFSGLKTSVRQQVAALAAICPLDAATIADLAAGFQAAVCDVLADRCSHAMEMFRSRDEACESKPYFVVAGGVAANQAVRARLTALAAAHGFHFAAPPLWLCTDNAAMVAWAGAERYACGMIDSLDVAPRPRWPLDAMTADP